MTSEALDAYGWRIAFLLGAGTLPFGFWLRSVLPETSCKLPPLAFASTVVSNAVGIAAAPLGGGLGDRAGRRPNDMATDRRAAAASYHPDRGLVTRTTDVTAEVALAMPSPSGAYDFAGWALAAPCWT